MAARPFVLTGSPGTDLGRTAALLTKLGASCGTEDIFHPASFERGGTLFWPPTLQGDASWFAAPIVDRLPAQCVVLHQTARPERVLGALRETEFFMEDTPSRRFVEDFLEEPLSGDPLVDGARVWVEWNRMVAAKANSSDVRYLRFAEDELDEFAMCEMLALLGIVRGGAAARAALEASPIAATGSDVTWSKLGGPEFSELRAAARGFSYDAA